MQLAGRYSYAGREWVTDRVRKIIGGNVTDTVHNHHNYAWRENHHGKDLWVVRKGATPAFPGQRGFVGGSMGDDCVIIEGADLDESPMAYRRLPDVLAEHAGTIKVLHTLRPFAVAMAGGNIDDPFRD